MFLMVAACAKCGVECGAESDWAGAVAVAGAGVRKAGVGVWENYLGGQGSWEFRWGRGILALHQLGTTIDARL